MNDHIKNSKDRFDIINIYYSDQHVRDLLLLIQPDKISKNKRFYFSKKIWEKLIHEYCKFISHIGKHKPEEEDYETHLLQNGKIKTRFNAKISQNEKKYLSTLCTAVIFSKANRGTVGIIALNDIYKKVAKQYSPNACCINCNCIFNDSFKYGKIAKYCSTKCKDRDKIKKRGKKRFLNRFNKLPPEIREIGYTETNKYRRGK